MTAQNRPLAFASVAERLGKIIPRLASDHPGEVAATVAAIGRLLQGVGLDWHDLGQRVATPSFDDVMALTGKPSPASAAPWNSAPERKPATWGPEREAEFQASQKPKKEPPPWPTWGTLSHFGRIEQLAEIEAAGVVPAEEAERFATFHDNYYRHQIPPGRKTINLFNAACRTLWERGARPEGKAA